MQYRNYAGQLKRFVLALRPGILLTVAAVRGGDIHPWVPTTKTRRVSDTAKTTREWHRQKMAERDMANPCRALWAGWHRKIVTSQCFL